MGSIFDGMTGVLNSVFGTPVTIITSTGAFIVTGVLRNESVEVAADEGEPVLTVLPVLKLRTGDTNGLQSGDEVMAENGTTYIVRHSIPSESPASDRFETFILRKKQK